MRKIFPMISASVTSKIVKPVLIVSGAAVVFVSLWSFQQDNINSLEQKIDKLSVKIVKASSIDERLKLEKDVVGFEKDKTIIQNGAYTNLVQALGGLVLSMTAWVGYQNFRVGEKNLKISEKNLRVSEDKQVTERFSKSIEHLGSDKIDIRLGGIYALEQIAIDSAKYHWTIVEILSAFVREKCPLDNFDPPAGNSEQTSVEAQSEQKTSVSAPKKVGVDIQAAMTVLGRRKAQDPPDKSIDLRSVNLPFIEIQEASLRGANLSGADLSGANLIRADLSEAFLYGANLSGADLDEADLNEANLSGANLSGADLGGANLYGANLNEANLSGAFLDGAKLYGANLHGANLHGAFLWGANLSGADLNGADLSGADLSGADLSGANLNWANLCEADLINIKVRDTRFRDNLGISDDMKKELEGKGAIFENSPSI
jgi:uncharacterized protein YjbI with pentapeptide repeats